MAISLPKKKTTKRLTKFWKTPSPRKESPNDISNKSISEVNRSIDILVQFFQNFLNKELTEYEDKEVEALNEVEKENLGRLSEESIQVFDFEMKTTAVFHRKKNLYKRYYSWEEIITHLKILEGIYYLLKKRIKQTQTLNI